MYRILSAPVYPSPETSKYTHVHTHQPDKQKTPWDVNMSILFNAEVKEQQLDTAWKEESKMSV